MLVCLTQPSVTSDLWPVQQACASPIVHLALSLPFASFVSHLVSCFLCDTPLRRLTSTWGEAAFFFSISFLFLQMAATQDVKGKGEGGDQNFDYMFKLLIIGNSSVGKTSFLFRYADDAFTSAFVSTVGIDFKVKTVYKNEKRIKLQIWVWNINIKTLNI